jgi:hypothetical protein
MRAHPSGENVISSQPAVYPRVMASELRSCKLNFEISYVQCHCALQITKVGPTDRVLRVTTNETSLRGVLESFH